MARFSAIARFLGLTFIGGFGMAAFFAFLASSSFIYIDHYGLTPTHFSIAFSVNAVGFIGASQFAPTSARATAWRAWCRPRCRPMRPSPSRSSSLTLAGVDSLAVLIVMLFLAFACLGLVIPSTMVLSLEEHGPIAGMASALGGTLQMVAGGVLIVVVSALLRRHVAADGDRDRGLRGRRRWSSAD